MAKTELTLILRVEGDNTGIYDPNVAFLRLTAAHIERLFVQMDQVAALQPGDPSVQAIQRNLDPLDWRPDNDAWDEHLQTVEYTVISDEELANLESVVDSAQVELVSQLTTDDSVHWRAYPKHGDGFFVTVEIDKADLERLLARLRNQ